MKTIIKTLLILCFVQTYAQPKPAEITLKNGQRFLLGKIQVTDLKTAPYNTWYTRSYDAYSVQKESVRDYSDKLKTHQIKVFLGTWCGDSKREVPRFIKILESINYPLDKLEIIAVDRREGKIKTSPGGEHLGWNIVKVPTIIFHKNGREVNRIIESPIQSLEKDMACILSGTSYLPRYAHLKVRK